uniref:HTH cro/C1-type domain-containing protein n=1 Tax=Setaria italica TaxID=4555 RepID=K3YLH7_SETIT
MARKLRVRLEVVGDLREKLKQARKSEKLNVGQLAQKIGVEPQAIEDYQSGKEVPPQIIANIEKELIKLLSKK